MDPPLPAIAAARVFRDRSVERMATYAIHAAFELGLLAALEREPMDRETLGSALRVDPGALYRLMRALVSLDVLSERDGVFGLGQMAPYARGSIGDPDQGNPLEWAWGELAQAIRSGRPAFEAIHGLPLFAYLDQHPHAAERFYRRMRERGEERDAHVAGNFDFGHLGTIVDVGGGTGGLLARIIERNPGSRGVLFDQPAVIDRAAASLRDADRARIELIAGDMFASIPSGGDAYLLSSILHDWDDEAAIRILRTVHTTMTPWAELLIVELVLPDDRRDTRLELLDLEMMALTGGRERTRSEYAALLRSAGFEADDMVATASLYSILSARRA